MSQQQFVSDLVDLEVTIHAESKRDEENMGAVLVSLDGEGNNAVWVPKSKAQIDRKGGKLAEITLPEWLAQEKGLI